MLKIFESKYKNEKAVTISNGHFQTVIMPSQGAKIVSFKDCDEREYLLQNKHENFIKMGYNDPFEKCECAGFDDLFPTVEEITFSLDGKDTLYRDHGEVCRLPFSYEIFPDKLICKTYSERLNYTFTKTFYEEDDFFKIDYEIENKNDFNLPFIFGTHLLINTCDKGKILTPYSNGDKIEVLHGNDLLKQKENTFDDKCLTTDFSLSGKMAKIYFCEKAKQNFIGYKYPFNKTFMLNYELEKLPFMEIWFNNGGLNDDYCVALEPCNIPYDDILNAKKHGFEDYIKPKSKFTFWLKMSVK